MKDKLLCGDRSIGFGLLALNRTISPYLRAAERKVCTGSPVLLIKAMVLPIRGRPGIVGGILSVEETIESLLIVFLL